MATVPGDGSDATKTSIGSRVTRGLKFPKKKRARKASRRWFGRKPKKDGWQEARAAKGACEVCGKSTIEKKERVGEDLSLNAWEVNNAHVDHIIPERMILQLCPEMDPHHKINQMTLDSSCHGIKTGADRLFCKGDKLRFLQRLRENNWPMERVEAALQFYGFSSKPFV